MSEDFDFAADDGGFADLSADGTGGQDFDFAADNGGFADLSADGTGGQDFDFAADNGGFADLSADGTGGQDFDFAADNGGFADLSADDTGGQDFDFAADNGGFADLSADDTGGQDFDFAADNGGFADLSADDTGGQDFDFAADNGGFADLSADDTGGQDFDFAADNGGTAGHEAPEGEKNGDLAAGPGPERADGDPAREPYRSAEEQLGRDGLKGVATMKDAGEAVTNYSRVSGAVADAIGASPLPDSVARAGYAIQDAIANAATNDTGRGAAIADGATVGLIGAGFNALVAGVDASDRGVSTPAVIADGAVGGLLDIAPLGPVDAAVNAVNGIVGAIVSESGTHVGNDLTASGIVKGSTELAASVTPGEIFKGAYTGSVDLVDAAIRGGGDQLAAQHDQNLAGKYGGNIQHFAVAADFAGALATNDQEALNALSDKAAAGDLGLAAEFGDWLGGAVWDVMND